MPSLSVSTHPSRAALFSTDLPRRILVGLAATLAVALAAHIAFPLPFTPVPFTLQPLAVLCVGLFLGPIDGALVMLAYLAEGAAGLPVFSPTGPGGLGQLVGPTGGFLVAYPVVAFLTGGITRKLRSSLGAFLSACMGGLAATAVLFASGAAWLAHVAHLTPLAVWAAAVAPFLPGEAVKIAAAAGAYRALSLPTPRTRA